MRKRETRERDGNIKFKLKKLSQCYVSQDCWWFPLRFLDYIEAKIITDEKISKKYFLTLHFNLKVQWKCKWFDFCDVKV